MYLGFHKDIQICVCNNGKNKGGHEFERRQGGREEMREKMLILWSQNKQTNKLEMTCAPLIPARQGQARFSWV